MEFVKDIQYYNYARTILIDSMLPSVSGRFLEIGCGTGATLEYLKSRGASYVAGIDTNERAIALAGERGVDLVLVADVEKDGLPFSEKEFDCIVFGDVLEHLYNPWDALKNTTRYLKDDGHVLMSIPNVKHYLVLKELILRDRWSYCDSGILDNTHIRFFTLEEIKKLLNFAGLKISSLRPHIASGRKFKLLNALFFNRLESFAAVQYYVLATKVK